jgi:putative transposase
MDDFTQQMLEALAKGDLDVGEVMRGLVRAEVEKGVNSVLKAELTGVLGYGKSEQGKAKEAGNSRDGYYQRKISTAYGDISVDVPRDRNGEFSTALLKPYQRRTDDIGQTVAKLYSAGMTDSEISEFVAFLYKGSYPASTISAITDCLKEDVEAFRSSPIEPDWLAVFIDSTYVPLRRKTVEKEAINIAMGITMTGERRVIGWSITPQESAAEWASLLQSFKKRGMRSARIVVSDGLPGISGAIDEAFPEALRQRCVVHLARDLGAKVRPADRAPAMQGFMALARMASRKEALAGFAEFLKRWGAEYPSVRRWGESLDLDEVFAFYSFDGSLRGKLYTNNCIEGFNKQIKRLLKKHIQFVDEEAMEKCLVSIFLHYNDRLGKRPIRGKEHIDDKLIEG